MKNKTKNKVLIVGGNFHNKGAELMVRTTISILKTVNVNYEPVIIDSFPDVNRNEKTSEFKVLNLPYYLNLAHVLFHGVNFNMFLVGKVIRCFLGALWRKNILSDLKCFFELRAIKRETCLIIDISGYGFKTCNQQEDMFNYIQIFFSLLSRKKSIPYLYFPQSFGDFAKPDSFFGNKLKKDITNALNNAKLIFCREYKSLNSINEYSSCAQSTFWVDIVLLYSYSKNNYQLPVLLNKEKAKNSVVIIPNSRLYDYYPQDEVDTFFLRAISCISEHGLKVIILRHSADDLGIVKNLERKACDFNNVLVLASDYEIEVIDEILSSAFFVISGRYHGLIASLKNSVPCIAIGWANKYNELMDLFDLNDYLFDFRLECNYKYNEVVKAMIKEREKLILRIKKTNLKLAEKYPLEKFIYSYKTMKHSR
jgi:polysaccharide pyruvyl transferase WcaK-like protein